MKSFKEYIIEAAFAGADDLPKLQLYYNKYLMNLDMGNETQAKKYLKQVKTYKKKVINKDINSTNSAGKKWSEVLKDI